MRRALAKSYRLAMDGVLQRLNSAHPEKGKQFDDDLAGLSKRCRNDSELAEVSQRERLRKGALGSERLGQSNTNHVCAIRRLVPQPESGRHARNKLKLQGHV